MTIKRDDLMSLIKNIWSIPLHKFQRDDYEQYSNIDESSTEQ